MFGTDKCLLGVTLGFGVFQNYYTRLPQFKDDPNIAVIGTVSTSIQFLGAPLSMLLVQALHYWQKHMIVAGSVLCVASLFGASFASSVPMLIATQGVLYGTGFLIMYFPVLSLLNEWFVQRRGFAYGVLFAGGGMTGVGLPFLLEWLLSTYGYRVTLRGIAIAQGISLVPTFFLLKRRLPPSRGSVVRSVDLSFFSNPHFWILAVSNLLQGFAYYIPSLYLPSFAAMLGLSSRVGALLLAAHNAASILGQVGFGYLSDKLNNIYILVCISTVVPSIASFCIWGYAQSLGPLLAFAIIFGWFAGGYVVFWPKFGSLVSEDPRLVYGLMAFGKGVGNVLTGPIAASLLTKPVSGGYGMGKYEPIIIYIGTLMLASSLGIVGWPLRFMGIQTR